MPRPVAVLASKNNIRPQSLQEAFMETPAAKAILAAEDALRKMPEDDVDVRMSYDRQEMINAACAARSAIRRNPDFQRLVDQREELLGHELRQTRLAIENTLLVQCFGSVPYKEPPSV
jgi:hypothetical protein